MTRGATAWRWIRRSAPWALAALVVVLIADQARGIDWPSVGHALKLQPLSNLVAAAALAIASFGLFACYDLVGRRETRHGLPVPRTLRIAAICYAFNLNFGSLVGALALKLRLYTRAGLEVATVTRVIVLAIVTNWLGYLAVAGTVLVLAPPPMPERISLAEPALRAIGGLMGLAVAGYLVACRLGSGREYALRGHRFTLPSGGTALVQLALAAANWTLIGVIVWVLLGRSLPYPTVLAVLLLAAVAGVVTHVPAGLGVIEAVFVASLGGQMAHGTLIAALLAYRATYYLFPLALAAVGYALTEARGRGGDPDTGAQRVRKASMRSARRP